MKTYVYLIGSTDDFDSIEDLRSTYLNGGPTERNMSVFRIELSEACRVTGYDTLADIATIIGRGEAMSNDWCMDDTVSTLLEA